MTKDDSLKCHNCYFFKNVNLGGRAYNWCFHTNFHGVLFKIKKTSCSGYDEFRNIFDIKPDYLSKNQRIQRNNKVKRKCQVFRFHYSINNQIISIISRYSHWIIILSSDKEHLFHQNISKLYEYEQMQLFNKPQFHLHKVIDNSPMAIQSLFEEIDNHDTYALKYRYQGSIKRDGFKATDFNTSHVREE